MKKKDGGAKMKTEKVRSLSDNELRIKVAELCGWERGPTEDIKIHGLGVIAAKGKCWHRKDEEDNWQDNPPDYLHDLNAMHEAVKTLSDTDKIQYRMNLMDLIGYESSKSTAMFEEIDASARQRAEAFVLTMEERE